MIKPWGVMLFIVCVRTDRNVVLQIWENKILVFAILFYKRTDFFFFAKYYQYNWYVSLTHCFLGFLVLFSIGCDNDLLLSRSVWPLSTNMAYGAGNHGQFGYSLNNFVRLTNKKKTSASVIRCIHFTRGRRVQVMTSLRRAEMAKFYV